MKNLFSFILKQVHWLLFFFLLSFSLYLLVHKSEFQRSKYLWVFQEIAGRVYSVSNSIYSYLNLKTTNADLMQRIGALEEEIQTYKKELVNLSDRVQSDTIRIGADPSFYHYIHARVTRNEIFGINNYILLDKGSKNGVKEDMAVISVNGIVGVVAKVTPNFSRVIPVLNPDYHPSCIIKDTRFFGTLFWDGKDPRYITLSRLPSHTSYQLGDTIVTSGYSAVFPEGLLVGVVQDAFKQKNEESNSLKIRLLTDFSTLSEVFVIWNPLQEERMQIEKGVDQE